MLHIRQAKVTKKKTVYHLAKFLRLNSSKTYQQFVGRAVDSLPSAFSIYRLGKCHKTTRFLWAPIAASEVLIDTRCHRIWGQKRKKYGDRKKTTGKIFK